jgi:hypothetical protein
MTSYPISTFRILLKWLKRNEKQGFLKESERLAVNERNATYKKGLRLKDIAAWHG